MSVTLEKKDRRYTDRLITRGTVTWVPLSVLPAPAPWLRPSTNMYKSPYHGLHTMSNTLTGRSWGKNKYTVNNIDSFNFLCAVWGQL